MPRAHTRVSIIGCGHVGTSCAYAILHTRLAREIVLISNTAEHVQGEAMDLQHAVHPRKIDRHAAMRRIEMALERRAGSKSDHRRIVLGAELDGLDDVL